MQIKHSTFKVKLAAVLTFIAMNFVSTNAMAFWHFTGTTQGCEVYHSRPYLLPTLTNTKYLQGDVLIKCGYLSILHNIDTVTVESHLRRATSHAGSHKNVKWKKKEFSSFYNFRAIHDTVRRNCSSSQSYLQSMTSRVSFKLKSGKRLADYKWHNKNPSSQTLAWRQCK